MSAAAAVTVGFAAAHAVTAAYLVLSRSLSQSRRLLGISLLATLPGAGIVLALIAARVEGKGGSPAFSEPEEEAVKRRSYELLLADREPLLHRLNGARSDRLAALSELSRARTPEAIGALRWVIERGGNEAVVDAALTLEQMMDEGMKEAASIHSTTDAADAEFLVRAGTRVATMISSSLADPSIAPRLAVVARDMFAQAETVVGALSADLAIRWARLELGDMNPETAMELLDRCEPDAALADELAAVERDARFAARHG